MIEPNNNIGITPSLIIYFISVDSNVNESMTLVYEEIAQGYPDIQHSETLRSLILVMIDYGGITPSLIIYLISVDSNVNQLN